VGLQGRRRGIIIKKAVKRKYIREKGEEILWEN
jgi:hypothetical protein